MSGDQHQSAPGKSPSPFAPNSVHQAGRMPCLSNRHRSFRQTSSDEIASSFSQIQGNRSSLASGDGFGSVPLIGVLTKTSGTKLNGIRFELRATVPSLSLQITMNSKTYPKALVSATWMLIACIGSLGLLSGADAFATDPSGVWRGEWRSGSTGHRGPMRVAIRPDGNGAYQARFSGRFALVIPFAYRATLTPSLDTNGNSILTSSKQLGPLLGSYNMQTRVSGSQFYGSFQAAGDNGTVSMQRVR